MEQVGGPLEPEAGRLLIASELMSDPNFVRTLVLLLNVDEDGVLGVVLNRRSPLPVGEVLHPWRDLVREPAYLYAGGPVETDAALCVGTLGSTSAEPAGWRALFGRTGLIDLDADADDIATLGLSLRIYCGYAGWGTDQLQREIDQGGWYVVPALPQDLYARSTDRLWTDVLRRQPGSLALLATLPERPESN